MRLDAVPVSATTPANPLCHEGSMTTLLSPGSRMWLRLERVPVPLCVSTAKAAGVATGLEVGKHTSRVVGTPLVIVAMLVTDVYPGAETVTLYVPGGRPIE